MTDFIREYPRKQIFLPCLIDFRSKDNS